MEKPPQIAPVRAEDFAAVRELCNGFIEWCRKRYGENAWVVDRYYTPENWVALLDSLPKIHARPEGGDSRSPPKWQCSGLCDDAAS